MEVFFPLNVRVKLVIRYIHTSYVQTGTSEPGKGSDLPKLELWGVTEIQQSLQGSNPVQVGWEQRRPWVVYQGYKNNLKLDTTGKEFNPLLIP